MRKAVTMILLLAVLLFVFTTCGGIYIDPNDGDNGMGGGIGGGYGGGGGSGNRDSRLVNGANDAWVDDAPNDDYNSLILKADGTSYYLEPSGGAWSIFDSGKWSTSGNSLTITSNQYGTKVTYTYTVNGNNLTLKISGNTYTLTKKPVSVV